LPKAIAALFAAAACGAWAQSSVTLQGTADMYVGSMKFAGGERKNQVGSGGMTTSWLGFKGEEDLGGGLKAGFSLGSYMRMNTGALGRFNGDTAYARDANVSLSGAFGTVKLGRSASANFIPSVLANPFGGSFVFSPLILHMDVANVPGYTRTIQADTGWSNQIVYSTPRIAGGLVASLHYQFSDGDDRKNNVGVDAIYASGPLTLVAFYEQVRLTNPNVTVRDIKTKQWMVGGAYDLQAAKLFASYGGSDDLVNKGDGADTWQLGVSVPLGAGKVLASYAQTGYEPAGGGSDLTRKTLSLGYDHALSKRTDVYTIVMHDRFTGTRSGTSFAVGLRHNF
jgi:predicted porin